MAPAKDDRMHTYQCDGMPSMSGCGSEIRITLSRQRLHL